MSSCGYSEELLSAFADGEAGARQRDVEQHLERCASCRETLLLWRESGQELVRVVDAGLGDVEPLVALSRIRTRIAAAEERSFPARLAARWRELWTYNRKALAGVMVAAALGALTAPFVVLWAGRHLQSSSAPGASFAGVVIESMELGGGTQVIYQGQSGTTTLIWVEPDASQTDTSAGPSRSP